MPTPKGGGAFVEKDIENITYCSYFNVNLCHKSKVTAPHVQM
jgi:hypothetical protein